MRHSHKLSWIFLIVALPAIACLSQALPTAISSETPTPTATLKPLDMEDRQSVDVGGFSFQSVVGFPAKVRASQATISNPDSTLLISLVGAPSENSSQTVEDTLNNFVSNLSHDISDFHASESYSVTVGGVDGLAVDVTGVLFGDELTGKIVVAGPANQQFFFAFGFATDEPGGQLWEDEGRAVFETVLSSIEFFKPVSDVSPTCVISDDPTYGYTEANPIKVGGGDFDGPPREQAYLDNLRGPTGEELAYTRANSFAYEDALLDNYEITGLEEPVTLYIDEYSYTEPQAPVGFTCAGAFPLPAPEGQQ